MILTALLARLGWQRRKERPRESGKTLLMRRLRADREQAEAEREAARIAEEERNRPPPTPEQLIEEGVLKVIPSEVEKPLPKPAPASFNLPAAGWRLAGLAYNADRTLYAMVQLLPGDAFWLDERRFPVGQWKTVRLAGTPTRVQRMGGDLCVENPREGGEPGCWMPLKIAGGGR